LNETLATGEGDTKTEKIKDGLKQIAEELDSLNPCEDEDADDVFSTTDDAQK